MRLRATRPDGPAVELQADDLDSMLDALAVLVPHLPADVALWCEHPHPVAKPVRIEGSARHL